MTPVPETGYVKSGDVHLAFQVSGDGPIDLLYASGFLNHVEHAWELPAIDRFLTRLGTFARVIRFDRRGVGLSDRLNGQATLEERMEDTVAVLDHVGSTDTALFGVHEGGPVLAMFAATHPERVRALVLHGSFARQTITDDYPWGLPPESIDSLALYFEATWGKSSQNSTAQDPQFQSWLSKMQRLACSPREAAALTRAAGQIDIRPILPTISVPTLVLHRRDEIFSSVDHGRYLAAHIPGARFVELEGRDHLPFLGDADAVVGEIQEFLTGTRTSTDVDRILATVLFTDVVGSTQHAVALGDQKWRDLQDAHHRVVRRALERFRGVEVDTAGDGFFATFDGPARAIRCALAICEDVKPLGLEIRAGLHTGEVERRGDAVSGIAVHLGARVSAKAGASEVLVSRTVADLVAGSGIEFEDRGTHELKGIPGDWQLLSVVG
jgi:class 3 adenylate cyclase